MGAEADALKAKDALRVAEAEALKVAETEALKQEELKTEDRRAEGLRMQGYLNAQLYDARMLYEDCAGRRWADIRKVWQDDGYAIIKPCSLDSTNFDELNLGVANLISNGPSGHDPRGFTVVQTISEAKQGRVQDLYKSNPVAAAIALDDEILSVLTALHHGKKAFPFQTLNFHNGTQQPAHSDIVHFDSYPERKLMAAAWVALEDVHDDSGPLLFWPGTHSESLWDCDSLGIREQVGQAPSAGSYNLYEEALRKALEKRGKPPLHAIIKKGEVFMWAASLVHGGSEINKPGLTRK